MKPHVEVHITAGALRAMTPEQLASLRDTVLRDGVWETVEGPLRIDGGDYLGVYLPGLFIGIEKDGYAHS